MTQIRRLVAVAAFALLPFAATLDAQAVYFVEDSGGAPVVKVLGAIGALTVFTPPPPFTQITALAADVQGRVFVALFDGVNAAQIHRIDPSGAVIPILIGPNVPIIAMSVDHADRVVFFDQFDEIHRINGDGSNHQTLVTRGLVAQFDALTVDLLGTVHCIETSFVSFTSTINFIQDIYGALNLTNASGAPASALLGGLHVDPDGRLYYDEIAGGLHTLNRLDPTGATPIFSVQSPESIGRSHATTGSGAQIALVLNTPSAAGPIDRIVDASTVPPVTYYAAPPSANITDLAVVPELSPFPNYTTGSIGLGSGGPFDVLTVNGSAGNATREVVVAPATTFTLSVGQPPSSPSPLIFALFSRLGRSSPSEILYGPAGAGDLASTPCPLAPNVPGLFTIADGFGFGCPVLSPGAATPWSLTVPGGVPPSLFGFTVEFTLQAVLQDAASPIGLATSNAVVVRITTTP